MKKIALLLLAAVVVTTSYQCKPPVPLPPTSPSITYTVEEADKGFKNLPALQSFVLGQSGDLWLIFGGRTNGFHGFGDNQNFPYKKANQYVYIYNTATDSVDSVSVDVLPYPLREQYKSTNMECRQIDSFLYVCGGYGVIKAGTPDSTWVTHGVMSRVNVPKMIRAIQAKDTKAMASAVVYTLNDLVRATGGELYKLADGNFYLVVGHNFTGAYGDTSKATTQVYTDQVRVFSLQETDSSITMVMPIQLVSDGLPDSTTQFRRRDLVVAPNVLGGGKSYGIGIYGGVFTYTPGCPSCNGGNPFRFPIYITGGTKAGYKVDSSFTQPSNIYSAPNLQMYDGVNDIMYTTIMGGLGDTLYPGKTDTTTGDNASFTKLILTLQHNNKTNATATIYSSTGMPHYIGAEGLFIRAANAPVYNSNTLDIIDYNKIPTGSTQLLGYIYGGIHSDGTQWGSPGNPTHASNKVYKVSVTIK